MGYVIVNLCLMNVDNGVQCMYGVYMAYPYNIRFKKMMLDRQRVALHFIILNFRKCNVSLGYTPI